VGRQLHPEMWTSRTTAYRHYMDEVTTTPNPQPEPKLEPEP
jgi:hypothetical protein